VRKQIEQLAADAAGKPSDDFEDWASELGQYRAYFMDPSQLRAESRAILDELRDWKVPALRSLNSPNTFRTRSLMRI
jgi:hypothetical protein